MTKRKFKKILLCTSSTVPDYAGDGRNAFNFARSLRLFGQESTVLSLNWYLVYPCREIIGSVPVYRIPYFNENLLQKIISRIIAFPYYLYFIAKNDVIIIYGRMIAYTLLILAGRLLGKDVIFRSTLYGFDDFNTLLNNPFRRIAYGWTYKLINEYFSLTPAFTSAYLLHNGRKDNLFESCQGVDTSTFFPVSVQQKIELRRKLGLPKKELIIISVGPLIKRKGYDEVFDILSTIDKSFLYVVVGDNAANKNIWPLKKEKELSRLYNKGRALMGDKILFKGIQTNVNEYLQSADIFLLNSFKEGLPNVLLEAMACGTAPVVRNMQGIKDYIAFCGVNAEIYSNDLEMKNFIIKLMQDNEYRKTISINSARFIQGNCSFDLVTQKFVVRFCSD